MFRIFQYSVKIVNLYIYSEYGKYGLEKTSYFDIFHAVIFFYFLKEKFQITEVVIWRCSVQKVFLEMSQN